MKALSVAAGAVRISRNAARFTRRIARFREIVGILGAYGFEDLLTKIRTPHGWLGRLTSPKTENLNTWQRARRACEDLGPTFVKFAQLLTARPDVLPPPLIQELKHLRDQVKPEPFSRIEPTLEKELGARIQDVFDDFIREPFAAGSLAQVYRARLRENGRLVAIKIQRPDIRPTIEIDLEFITWFSRALHESFHTLRVYDLPAVMEETREGFLRELDFTIEANNSIIFNSLNPFPESVFAPRVYPKYTTPRLLVADWITGWTPDSAPFGADDRKKLARAGGDSVLHQIVISGFFHADPHGGNILITPDRRICLLDWGLVGQLTRFMRYFLADLLSAIAAQDAAKAVWVASRLSRSNRFIDAVEMEKQVTVILRKYKQAALTGDAVGNLILEMIYVFATNGINVVKDFTLLARAVVAIESTARALDPQFSLATTARPFLKQLARERWNPETVFKEGYRSLLTALTKLQELPGDIQRVVRRFESQDISVRFMLEGMDRLDELLGSATNRLVMGLIIAATIIGSSMLVAFSDQTTVLGVPMGNLGFLISTMMGLWIIIDILRHGRHK